MIKFISKNNTSNNIKNIVCLMILVVFSFFACKTESGSSKSRSIGAPGEVLLVIDKSLQNTEVKEIIAHFSSAEFPCVPQFETVFKLITIAPNDFEGHFKAYRNIIVVKQLKSKSSSVNYKRDKWASSQQLVEIEFKSEASFAQVFNENRDQIFDFLYYGDIRTMSKANEIGADAGLKNFIQDKYNIEMTLPQGFRLVQDTLSFSWFRFDRLETIQSIIIHEFDMDSVHSLASNDLIALRNYVAEKYVPGPNENSYMTTESRLPIICNQLTNDVLDAIEVRGLWKVEGFFMGGPFVNYFIKDKENNKLIMIEGFVYAPKKQNKSYFVRQVESILQSVKLS